MNHAEVVAMANRYDRARRFIHAESEEIIAERKHRISEQRKAEAKRRKEAKRRECPV